MVMCKTLAQDLQRPRVPHIGGLEPSAPRHPDAERHVSIELSLVVRVGADDHRHAHLLGHAQAALLEVEAIREGVELDRGADALGGGEHLLDVDGVRVAAGEQPPGRVTEDVDDAALQRSDAYRDLEDRVK